MKAIRETEDGVSRITTGYHGYSEGEFVVFIEQDRRWWIRILCYIYTLGRYHTPVKKTYRRITNVTKTTFDVGEELDKLEKSLNNWRKG